MIFQGQTGISGGQRCKSSMASSRERRHLWTKGITTRPSETIRRQVYVNFW